MRLNISNAPVISPRRRPIRVWGPDRTTSGVTAMLTLRPTANRDAWLVPVKRPFFPLHDDEVERFCACDDIRRHDDAGGFAGSVDVDTIVQVKVWRIGVPPTTSVRTPSVMFPFRRRRSGPSKPQGTAVSPIITKPSKSKVVGHRHL